MLSRALTVSVIVGLSTCQSCLFQQALTCYYSLCLLLLLTSRSASNVSRTSFLPVRHHHPRLMQGRSSPPHRPRRFTDHSRSYRCIRPLSKSVTLPLSPAPLPPTLHRSRGILSTDSDLMQIQISRLKRAPSAANPLSWINANSRQTSSPFLPTQ
jgi:hypothetical protein